MLSRPGEIRFAFMQTDLKGKQGLSAKAMYLSSRDLSEDSLPDMLANAVIAMETPGEEKLFVLSVTNKFSAHRTVLEVKDGVAVIRGEWLASNDKRYQAALKRNHVLWESDMAMNQWK